MLVNGQKDSPSSIQVIHDLAECEVLWRRRVPQENLSDLWEVRACFQRHFQRAPSFLVRGDHLLPLSLIEEANVYGYFPGETWHGRTWLEGNRVLADEAALADMLARCDRPYHLRYLLPAGAPPRATRDVDEIGYLFHPPAYGYDLENYFQEFSGTKARRLKKDLARFDPQGVAWRLDDPADFDRMVELSLGRFGDQSYFHDPRFREGFRDLARLLRERGWLRLTAVLIGGDLAAVDMGCLYNGTYTLLAGGTSAAFPGVAKVINIHHLQQACAERLPRVDFLCGDFSWKKLFHLAPRPLGLVSNIPEPARGEAPSCAA